MEWVTCVEVNGVAVVTAVFSALLYYTLFRDRVGGWGVGLLSFFFCRWLLFLDVVVFYGNALFTLLAYVVGAFVFLCAWLALRVGWFGWRDYWVVTAVCLASSLLFIWWGFVGRLTWVAVAGYLTFIVLYHALFRGVSTPLYVLGLGFGFGCMSDLREVIILFGVGGEPVYMRLLYEHFLLWVGIAVLLVAGRYVRLDARLILAGVVGVLVANLGQLWAVTCVNHMYSWVPSVCPAWGNIIPNWFAPVFNVLTAYLIRVTPIPFILGFRPLISSGEA